MSLYTKKRQAYKEGTTTGKLRKDIDSGKTGDKVNAEDPAAAPLGTDDEAAGVSLDPKKVKAVQEREREKDKR